MRRAKKSYLLAITLVIAGLLITMSASSTTQIPQKQNTVTVKEIEHGVVGKQLGMAKSLPQAQYRSTNTLGIDPLLAGHHPTVAGDLSQKAALGFESTDNPNVWFTSSGDKGATWNTDAVGWTLTEIPDHPDVDACGDGRFIGTMVPSYQDNAGASLYKIFTADPLTIPYGWTCNYWNWNALSDPNLHYNNFITVAVGGYTAVDPVENEWAYGGHSMVGDYVQDSPPVLLSQVPFFSYQMRSDGYAWIYNFNETINGSTATAMDVDQAVLYSYAVWNYNNNGNKDIYVYINNFGQWDTYQGYPIHPDVKEVSIQSPGNDNDMDISVYKNNSIIVSQRDNDIVAYYSPDALTTVNEVTIATGGTSPRITHTGLNRAAMEFVKDGSIYYSQTTNGGATWSTPTKIEDSTGVPAEHKSNDICIFGSTWMDGTNTYFEALNILPPTPRLEISLKKGFGIGVSGTVTNSGDAAATNVVWTIQVTGGTLGKINKIGTGTIPSLASAGTSPMKTGMIVGLGTIQITTSATCDEGATIGPITSDGTQFLFFTIVK